MTKRRPGTGTVQLHNDRWRLRLPRSLDPERKWLSETFAADEEAQAQAFMDECINVARGIRDSELKDEGVTLALVWPRYVSQVASTAARRHQNGGAKARSRLEGMGERWLAKAPFWRIPLPLVRGIEVELWLESLLNEGRSAKGAPVSSSWVGQLAGAIRGVFHMLRLEPPSFEVELERQKVAWAMNLAHQERFFQKILTDGRDRVMAGCQMGAGLRVGELLSLSRDSVHIERDPHLTVMTGGRGGAPTKSSESRRVELIEPGLGFFRIAVEHFYRDNDKGLLFPGPQGGYMSQWPEKFVGWSEAFGKRLTSHSLRHAYAYSMLSGFWGYPPVDLTFVSKQLGHSDVRTTQRFYGHWDPGAGVVMARVLRGEQQDLVEPVTANRLLGHKGRTSGKTRSPLCSPLSANSSKNLGKSLIWVNDGDSPNWGFSPGFLNEVDYRVVHETAGRLALAIVGNLDATEEAVAFLKSLGAHPAALRALALVVEGDARGIRQAIDLAGQVTASTERSQSSATAP